jgi:hypothetical protein
VVTARFDVEHAREAVARRGQQRHAVAARQEAQRVDLVLVHVLKHRALCHLHGLGNC